MVMSRSSSSLPDDTTGVRLVPFGLPDLPPPHASPAVLAELHAELLPTSPVVQMGQHFLRDFYYGVLPEEELVLGYLAYLDGAPVGFQATTRDANGFLSEGVRRRWGSLLALLARHPPSPRALRRAMEVGGDRRRRRHQQMSELLSMGVRPTRRSGETTGVSRRQVALTLIEAASQHLPRPVITLVDETNIPSRRLFEELGWTVSDRHTAGWPVPQLVYRWDRAGISG
jgi:hypothetical protein